MKVSVICAARNEEKTIRRCLDSLIQQTTKPYEIIIITDRSEDRTDEIAKEYARKYPFVKHFSPSKKPMGIAGSRDYGIRKARGEIIFVVDADAYYERNYIELCTRHLRNPKVGGVVGKIRVWEPRTFISKCRDCIYSMRWDDEENIRKEIKANRIAAWIFRRKDYIELGGYRKSLEYGEDLDFARRLMEKGYEIVYEPRALWYHKWKENVREVVRDSFERGRMDYTYRKSNPVALLKSFYFLLLPALLFLSFLGQMFIWVFVLLTLPLIAKFIIIFIKTKSKFRIYSLAYPLVACIASIPYSLGFLSRFLT